MRYGVPTLILIFLTAFPVLPGHPTDSPLQGRSGAEAFVCPPCGCGKDDVVHGQAGACPACGMGLIEKTADLAGVEAIPNFLKLNDQIWTAGQPTMEQMSALKKEGIRTIINLRHPSEHDSAGEEAKATELGIRYYNIPVVYSDPKPEQATQFLKILGATHERPVLIHCAAAIRVGAFWLIHRVVNDGWSYEKALEEANRIGLRDRPHLVEFVRSYLKK